MEHMFPQLVNQRDLQ